jgi:hypothetical protein
MAGQDRAERSDLIKRVPRYASCGPIERMSSDPEPKSGVFSGAQRIILL